MAPPTMQPLHNQGSIHNEVILGKLHIHVPYYTNIRAYTSEKAPLAHKIFAGKISLTHPQFKLKFTQTISTLYNSIIKISYDITFPKLSLFKVLKYEMFDINIS